MRVNTLVEDVAQKCEITRATARIVITTVLDQISAAIVREEDVKFDQLGAFHNRTRRGYVMRAPDGREFDVPPAKYLVFTPAPALRAMVQGSPTSEPFTARGKGRIGKALKQHEWDMAKKQKKWAQRWEAVIAAENAGELRHIDGGVDGLEVVKPDWSRPRNQSGKSDRANSGERSE